MREIERHSEIEVEADVDIKNEKDSKKKKRGRESHPSSGPLPPVGPFFLPTEFYPDPMRNNEL